MRLIDLAILLHRFNIDGQIVIKERYATNDACVKSRVIMTVNAKDLYNNIDDSEYKNWRIFRFLIDKDNIIYITLLDEKYYF